MKLKLTRVMVINVVVWVGLVHPTTSLVTTLQVVSLAWDWVGLVHPTTILVTTLHVVGLARC